ncbi:MAG: nickel pincer cofactor biosynthesis protein LarB [Spirochaetes bacterium]|nr:nickel pincer cofactor biosynthesis protein LarB [Spirochaetota bacterium]
MEKEQLLLLIKKIKEGKVTDEEACAKLATLPFEKIECATIDHHRTLRWGFPEIIFCEGKTPKQVCEIAQKIIDRGSDLLATRADEKVWEAVCSIYPHAHYNQLGRTISLLQTKKPPLPGKVLIVTAGTADLPVAEEARESALTLRLNVDLLCDVGVAGIHRILAHRTELESASILIVVAGMEGALPSVIGGLVPIPVIAVPTSVGYGTSFSGTAALFAMLNSCVPGIAVMNIDNGLGAAFLAFRILTTMMKGLNGDK